MTRKFDRKQLFGKMLIELNLWRGKKSGLVALPQKFTAFFQLSLLYLQLSLVRLIGAGTIVEAAVVVV